MIPNSLFHYLFLPHVALAWWQIAIQSVPPEKQKAQFRPRYKLVEETTLNKCRRIPLSGDRHVVQIESMLFWNSHHNTPKADYLAFYNILSCSGAPVMMIKLNDLSESLQSITFSDLGLMRHPNISATMGFPASDPDIRRYERELEGGESGLWVLKNPEGKYIWLDVVEVLNPQNTSAVSPGKCHDASTMTGAMLRDFRDFLVTKPPRRIPPIVDPVLGDKRVLMKILAGAGHGEVNQYQEDLEIEHRNSDLSLEEEIDLKSEFLGIDVLPMKDEETISLLKEEDGIVRNEEPWTISYQDIRNYFRLATEISQARSITQSFLNLAKWAKSEYQNWARQRGAPPIDLSNTEDEDPKEEEDLIKEEDLIFQGERFEGTKNEEILDHMAETDYEAGYRKWVQDRLILRAQNPVARNPQNSGEVNLYSVQKKLKTDQNGE
ncbi:hypothetical protein TWF694_011477 [Orbilia ellipsospora]|uniref:Uncharacterized protein n=1 Tax=Orbilia ellipsospora TaxID=2528407 RepID=A0AAV9X7Y8_9PEZI